MNTQKDSCSECGGSGSVWKQSGPDAMDHEAFEVDCLKCHPDAPRQGEDGAPEAGEPGTALVVPDGFRALQLGEDIQMGDSMRLKSCADGMDLLRVPSVWPGCEVKAADGNHYFRPTPPAPALVGAEVKRAEIVRSTLTLALWKIAAHFDMQGYGDGAAQDLIKEMGDVASDALKEIYGFDMAHSAKSDEAMVAFRVAEDSFRAHLSQVGK
jgi:hypothetical protein